MKYPEILQHNEFNCEVAPLKGIFEYLLSADKTVIVISHNRNIVRKCNTSYILKKGGNQNESNIFWAFRTINS